MPQPMRNDGEIFILREWVERHPQTKSFRQRNFLFHTFCRMNFLASVFRGEIILHGFRHQVAAVGSSVDQQVVGEGYQRAVERGLERLIVQLVGIKREVVAIQDETLRPARDQCDDMRQIGQPKFADFDQAQSFWCLFVEQCLDQR